MIKSGVGDNGYVRQSAAQLQDVASHLRTEMAKVHTSFPQVEVQILVFKNTLVKVEVLTKVLYSSQSKEGFEMYFSKKYP